MIIETLLFKDWFHMLQSK